MYSFFKSIRTKTAVLFFTVFLSVILPVHWLIYKEVERILVEASRKEINFEAEKLLSLVRLDPLTVPLPSEGYALKLQFQRDIQFEEIFTSPDFPELTDIEFLLPTIMADTFEIITVKKTVEQSNAYLLLSVGRSSDVLQQQLTSLRVYLFLAISGAISLSGILVFLASGWILNPIKRIAQAAYAINTSKDIEDIPLPATNDESRQLAESINAMLQRIQQSVKEQTNFFASAAHELRTPLAVMKAELTIANTEASAQRIDSLLHEVERLERVIHDFLLISELRADTLTIRKTRELLDEILYSALKKVKYISAAHSNHVQLTVEEGVKGYEALIDVDKMETVISNLVENAVKYSPRHSSIAISVTKKNDTIILRITNPIDQPIADTASLTQEFKKSKELSSGLGMGLWICDQIIKRHGAELELTSSGLTFMATLKIPVC